MRKFGDISSNYNYPIYNSLLDISADTTLVENDIVIFQGKPYKITSSGTLELLIPLLVGDNTFTSTQTVLGVKSIGTGNYYTELTQNGVLFTNTYEKVGEMGWGAFSGDLNILGIGVPTGCSILLKGDSLHLEGKLYGHEQDIEAFYGPRSTLSNNQIDFGYRYRDANGKELFRIRTAAKDVCVGAGLKLAKDYETDIATNYFSIASRYERSGIPHSSQGHILQVGWDAINNSPESSTNDGGWGLEFGAHGNPYLLMIGDITELGRSGGTTNIRGNATIDGDTVELGRSGGTTNIRGNVTINGGSIGKKQSFLVNLTNTGDYVLNFSHTLGKNPTFISFTGSWGATTLTGTRVANGNIKQAIAVGIGSVEISSLWNGYDTVTVGPFATTSTNISLSIHKNSGDPLYFIMVAE